MLQFFPFLSGRQGGIKSRDTTAKSTMKLTTKGGIGSEKRMGTPQAFANR
jgi:hypothetical protein